MDNKIQRFVETLIDSSEVKIVSFDFFDTLFFRPGFAPTDIFHLLGDRAAQLFGVPDFVAIRAAAENEMATSYGGLAPYRNLHTLEDIYRHIAKVRNLNLEKCLELYQFELEIERTILRPRRDVRSWYERAISLGKRVIIVSDTYFPKAFLDNIIEEKGFNAVSEVYVSNECGGRKDIGDIYSHVLEREGVEGSRILHIGDNLHSDVEMASAAGIPAVHCPAVIPDLINAPRGPWSEALASHGSLDPAARLLLGLAIYDWFLEHPVGESASLFEDNPRLFGFVGLGPILFHIAHEIAESKDIQDGYSGVCFASRDGHLPMRAYDILSERREKIPSRYVYCGRAAYDIYRYKGDPAAFISERTHRAHGYTLRSLLKYLFQMKDGELYTTLVNAFSKGELDSEYLDSRKAIKRVCAKYDARLRSFFEQERHLASQYYCEIIPQNESKRAIIFDVGYGGSVSLAIGALTGIQIDKIYLSANDKNTKSDRDQGTSTRILLPDSTEVSRDVPGIFLLFEELFSPTEPACVGFRKGEEIHPLFVTDEVFGSRMCEDLNAIQESALDFVRVAKETFGELAPYLRIRSAHHLLRPLQYAFGRSRECEERMLSNILFSDLFYQNRAQPLSTKVVHGLEHGNLPDRSGFNEPSKVVSRSNTALVRQFRIGIHLYLNDSASLQPILLAISRIPAAFDLFVSVDDERLYGIVERIVKSLRSPLLGNITIATMPGRGGIGSWIAAVTACESTYDLLCHFSTSNPDSSNKMALGWLQHLIEATLSPLAITGILSCFASDPKLGLLFPPVYPKAFEAMRTAPGGIVSQSIRNEMDRLLAEMNIRTGYNRSDFFFPVGDAFWCRPPALQPLVGLVSAQEVVSSDVSAAITRVLAVVSSAEGFVAKTFVPDTMLLRSYNMQRRTIRDIDPELAFTRQEIDRVTSSRAWKLACLIMAVSHRLLPNGSRRRKLLVSSLRCAFTSAKQTYVFLKRPKKELAKSLVFRLRTATADSMRGLTGRAKIRRLNRFDADHPVFSVVIPIYDRTWQLELAIESILKQTFRNFELILVCDGSPAETLEIVDRYIGHPQVRVHKFTDNSGNACRGRNTGISMARGTYVAFMDSDDISAHNRLWITLFHFLRTGADMVYGSVTIISDGVRKIDGIWDGQFRKSFGLTPKEMEDVNPAWTSTVAVRRETLLRFGAFRMAMRYREDQELWLRLAYNGCRLYPAKEMLAYYRFHENNAELLFKEQDAHWKAQMLDVYRQPYEG